MFGKSKWSYYCFTLNFSVYVDSDESSPLKRQSIEAMPSEPRTYPFRCDKPVPCPHALHQTCGCTDFTETDSFTVVYYISKFHKNIHHKRKIIKHSSIF